MIAINVKEVLSRCSCGSDSSMSSKKRKPNQKRLTDRRRLQKHPDAGEEDRGELEHLNLCIA